MKKNPPHKASKSHSNASKPNLQPEHQARKRFGQNFLHDPAVIDSIVHHINPQPDQHIVEIGPGLGALTQGLSTNGNQLSLIELDRDLILGLKLSFNDSSIQIFNSDALKFDFTELGSPTTPLRLVGNLPYNISTPLIFHLLSFSDIISDMHFMLQKEVVDRMCAEAGSKTYGRLSIMVQYQCEVECLINVGPGAFKPAPKVDSAVVRLTPKAPELPCTNPVKLGKLVTQAFSQRRKTIRNTLKGLVSDDIFEELNINPSARPETLAKSDYIRLTNRLES